MLLAPIHAASVRRNLLSRLTQEQTDTIVRVSDLLGEASTTAKAEKASNNQKVFCWSPVKTKLSGLLIAVAAFVVLVGAVVPASAQVVVKVGSHHRRHHRSYHHRR
jgi:hypothetical protein